MENAEEIYHFLEDFSKRKPKVIPQELNDYLTYVARTGDPVYQWPLVKSLFKEKLLNVITDFYEITPGLEIPPYPNVVPFSYDTMKNSLLERLDSFNAAPFTVQRICELLTDPRKQYNRIDKFMRAIEKNILVVSTREPGIQRPAEPENEVPEPNEPIVNGSDNSEYNVDVEMEDVSWKQNAEQNHVREPQPSSSDTHISVDDIEARLQAKQTPEAGSKCTTEYESLTPPEQEEDEMGPPEQEIPLPVPADVEPLKELAESESSIPEPEATDPLEVELDPKAAGDMKTEEPQEKEAVVIPEIKVDDAEMTEKRLQDEQMVTTEPVENTELVEKPNDSPPENEAVPEPETKEETQPVVTDESSSDSNTKEEIQKMVSEVSSSEENSMSSETTDGNSNSPKTEPEPQEVKENLTSTSDPITNEAEGTVSQVQNELKSETDEETDVSEETKADENVTEETVEPEKEELETKPVDQVDQPMIQSDNYSVADVDSELPQPPVEEEKKPEESQPEVKVGVLVDVGDQDQEPKDKDVSKEQGENKEA